MSEALASRLVSRTRAHLSEPLFRNAYSLMVNSIMSSGLGLVFWIVAARIYPTETVGRDSAMVAAMVTLSTICQLNLGYAIPRFMPLVANPARALRRLYALSTGLALVVSTGFVFVVPHLDEELDVLGDPAVAISFIVGTSLWGVFALQDGALTGLRHAPWVPLENTVFGVLKLVSLPLFLTIGVVNGIFLSWLGPMLLLLIPVNALIFGRVIPAHRRAHPERSARLEDINRGQLTRFLAQDFFASALFIGAVAILPLIVLSIVGGTGNAYYYIALTITLALEALVANAGMSLTVESAFAQERLRGLAKVVLQRALMLMVPCALILVVGAPVILSPFGEDYVQEATPLLRIFGLTVIFRTFILIFQYVSRSRGRGRSLLVADLCLFILLIGLTLVLTPEYGLVGAGVAWLVSNAAVAIAIAPGLLRFVFGHEDGEVAFGLRARTAPEAVAGGAVAMPLVTEAPLAAAVEEEPEPVELEGPEPEPEPEHERRRRPRLTAGGQLIILIALTATVASAAVMALGVHNGWSALALVLMFSLAPGAALLPFIGARGDGLSLGLVLATSLGISTVIAQAMIWVGWEPVSGAYAVAGLCIPAIVMALRTRGFRPRSLGEAFGDTAGPDTRRSRSMLARALRRPSTQFLILLGAAIFWAAGLDQTDLSHMDGFGLLSALGSGWYVALMLLVVGFALAIWSTPRIPGLYGAYVTGIVLLLHGSTALLYDVPRYSWTFKHLGVTEAIINTGSVDRSLDVYNNWPGFFALAAWLSESAGVEPITFAAWSQVFFTLATAAVLLFALRGLGISERVRWTAVWLYVVADWIGQNYFAPQAMGFVLSLAVIALCLRCAPEREGRRRRFDRWLDRRRGPVLGGLATLRRSALLSSRQSPLPARAALAVGAVIYLAVVVSHQLSPLLVTAQVAAIALVGARLSWWIPAAMLAIEVWWIGLAWTFVDAHFSLFDINPGASAGNASVDLASGLPGVEIVFWAPRVLLFGVFVLAAFGVLRLIQQTRAARFESRRYLDPVPIALAATPMIVVWLQSYGGEGILRASLFALPWLAVLGAEICAPRGGPSRRRATETWRLIGVTSLVGCLMLLAYFGTEKRSYIQPSDVAASAWYEENAPTGSFRAYLAPNFPLSMTANYATKRIFPDPKPALTSLPEFRHKVLGPVDVLRIRQLLLERDAPERYFVVSPSQENYAELYKLLPPGSADRLIDSLLASPDFELAFRDGDAYVFKLVPRREQPAGPA